MHQSRSYRRAISVSSQKLLPQKTIRITQKKMANKFVVSTQLNSIRFIPQSIEPLTAL